MAGQYRAVDHTVKHLAATDVDHIFCVDRELARSPRILTCLSPTSRTACFGATGARRWRCRERPLDTFDRCGNLFGAGIPINFDRAVSGGQLEAGDVVVTAAFAHVGDFAGAAAVRWGGRN